MVGNFNGARNVLRYTVVRLIDGSLARPLGLRLADRTRGGKEGGRGPNPDASEVNWSKREQETH